MVIASMANVIKLFGGGELNEEESQGLFDEVLLMTLARATKSDSNISPVEIGTVRRVIREVTGTDVSEVDIRVAASSELFESTPLEDALANVRRCLSADERVAIVHGLAEVILSDLRISESELDFFDAIANALGVRPSELAGLRKA